MITLPALNTIEMNFEYTEKSLALQKRVNDFMVEHIYTHEEEIQAYHLDHNNLWLDFPKLEEWKAHRRNIYPFSMQWLKWVIVKCLMSIMGAYFGVSLIKCTFNG